MFYVHIFPFLPIFAETMQSLDGYKVCALEDGACLDVRAKRSSVIDGPVSTSDNNCSCVLISNQQL